MQKLGPKMAAIRKKYENDKQRQSVETMNLYKAHGVSPFGGCLPSLIQMPIWIALYSTLNYAVELHRSPFIFHIHDLTAKDPFYITPLLMGGVMFLQMKMSPTSPDNQQQAMMSVMMPIMFTAFSLVLPSGLALYMLTSYLIGILQQLYVNRVDRKSGRYRVTDEPKLDLRDAADRRARAAGCAGRASGAGARAASMAAECRGPSRPAGSQPAPFGGADGRPIDDLELTFRAVDIGAVGEAGQPDKR